MTLLVDSANMMCSIASDRTQDIPCQNLAEKRSQHQPVQIKVWLLRDCRIYRLSGNHAGVDSAGTLIHSQSRRVWQRNRSLRVQSNVRTAQHSLICAQKLDRLLEQQCQDRPLCLIAAHLINNFILPIAMFQELRFLLFIAAVARNFHLLQPPFRRYLYLVKGQHSGRLLLQ